MISRPRDLEKIEVKLTFNFQDFYELEIDLYHINKNGRSSFTKVEVKEFVVITLNNKALKASATKVFKNEACSYFVINESYLDKPYKFVICICSDKPKTIGVITLHRV